MMAGLRTNQTNGMVTDRATAYKLQQQGDAVIFVCFADIVKDVYIHVIYATDKIMKKHTEEVRAFFSRWLETVQYMTTHKAETVKIAAPVMYQPPAIVAYAYDQVMPSFSDTGKFDPKGLAVLARSFVQMKLLPKEPDMSKLYTEKFLPVQS
jgi:ABC-type nitrate/sulfonate/bicarbonate transport system substrate-binding protein